MATGDKYPVLMASQLGSANGPAQLNSSSALPVSQGGTEENNNAQAIYKLGCGVRPNLIMNGIFVNTGTYGVGPINQKGLTTYTNMSIRTITIDRWETANFLQNPTLSISNDGISLFCDAGQSYGWWKQVFKSDVPSTIPVTLSILFANGDFYFGTRPINYSHPSFVLRFADGNNYIRLTQNESVDIVTAQTPSPVVAVKLEYGENQTLAYQDSNGLYQLLPQPYTDELRRCQEYQIVTTNTEYIRASYVTPTTIYFVFPSPATLQANPTFSGNLQVLDFASGAEQTGFSFSCYAYPGEIHITATKASHGLTDATLMIPAGVFDANI